MWNCIKYFQKKFCKAVPPSFIDYKIGHILLGSIVTILIYSNSNFSNSLSLGQVNMMWYFCLHFRSKKLNHSWKTAFKMMGKVKNRDTYVFVCTLNTAAQILETVCHRDAIGYHDIWLHFWQRHEQKRQLQATWRGNRQSHIVDTEHHFLHKQNKLS